LISLCSYKFSLSLASLNFPLEKRALQFKTEMIQTMKQKFFTLAVAVLAATSICAQAPGTFSYQAVVRDASNDLVTSSMVGMQISILLGSASGTVVYAETHTPTSNANGLVSLQVGGGTLVSGAFGSIDWGNGPFFIKTETDPAGGSSYSITGTQQLASVPYALHAGNIPNVAALNNLMVWDPTGTDHWVAASLSTTNAGSNQAVYNMQPFLAMNWCISLAGVFPSPSSADPLLGSLMLFAGYYAPSGWALCDGQLQSISSNTALYSLLGTSYGGNGFSSFRLPDLRGRVPMHKGTGSGLPSYSLGQVGGAHQISLITNQLPAHNHGVQFTH
jgi:microcystin-dependent protein